MSKLSLGPLPGPPGRSCALVKLTVGFLLRMDTRQGDLHFSCTGCECFRDSGDFTTKRSPFPRWHTDSSIADDPNQRQNFSVTATAEFLSLWRKSASCYLHITHLPRSPPAHPVIRAPSPTRVRVDSLVSEHRGVYGYARKVLMFPRSYPAGIQRARSLLDPARGCLEDCTGGRWPCPKPNASHVHNKSSSG